MSQPCRIFQGLSAFIAMIENLSEPWGIKDLHSRHLYMNNAARHYTHTPKEFSVEGVSDEEFPARWAECASELAAHDRRTEERKERVTVIETHYWFGGDSLLPYISEKLPVYDDHKNCVGVIWNAKPVEIFTPLKFINPREPTVLTTVVKNDLFTPAELDVIFLLLHRYTAKEISNIYNASFRTIENRIYTIYQKAGVHSLRQFEEYCHIHDLKNYLPARLIKKGIHFI